MRARARVGWCSRRSSIAALAAGLAFFLLAPTAGAAPSWLAASDLSAPGRSADSPVVVTDAAGETVVAWERQTGTTPAHNLEFTTRKPGEAFPASHELYPASTDPQLAMTPTGETIAAWRYFDGTDYVLQVATRPAGGNFSAPVDVATVETAAVPHGIRIAANAAGMVAIAWLQKDPASADPEQFSVLASVRPPGGGFTLPQIVSPLPLTVGNDSANQQLAVDEAGDVTVLWEYFDGTASVIQASRRSAGGEFEMLGALTTDEADASTPDLASAANGDTVAVWGQLDGTDRRIAESSSGPGEGFSAPQKLSEPGADAFSPTVAITPSGQITVAWERLNSKDVSVVQASAGAFGGGFAAPVDLSNGEANSFDPSLASNPDGATTVVWKSFEAANYVVQGTTSPAGGAFPPATKLSLGGEDAVFPSVAMDAAGDATAVWARGDGSNDTVQAAGFDADPPSLSDLRIPAQAMVGKPALFSVQPLDVWPISSTRFNFGDGGESAGAAVTHTYQAAGTYRVAATTEDAAGTAASGAGTIQVLPSNEFSLGRVSLNRRRGTGALLATVPGPGLLSLSGKGARKATVQAQRASQISIPIRAAGGALKRLRRRGRAKLALTVSFTPIGGLSLAMQRSVKLVKKMHR